MRGAPQRRNLTEQGRTIRYALVRSVTTTRSPSIRDGAHPSPRHDPAATARLHGLRTAPQGFPLLFAPDHKKRQTPTARPQAKVPGSAAKAAKAIPATLRLRRKKSGGMKIPPLTGCTGEATTCRSHPTRRHACPAIGSPFRVCATPPSPAASSRPPPWR